MATPRCYHCAVTIGDTIYIIGGCTNSYDYLKHKQTYDHLDSVEMFDTSSQIFRKGPTLPMPMSGMSAVVVGKLIVIIGGNTTDFKPIGHSYVLDTTAADPQWQKIDIPLQKPRWGHTAVCIDNNKLYVFGGSDGSNIGLTSTSIETIAIQDFLPPYEWKKHMITSMQKPAKIGGDHGKNNCSIHRIWKSILHYRCAMFGRSKEQESEKAKLFK